MGATIKLAERLSHHGYTVVPHLVFTFNGNEPTKRWRQDMLARAA